VGTSLLAGAAAAEETEARSGVRLIVGAGVEDFVGDTMRQTSNMNGNWGLHAAFDLQKHFVLEAGYIGTASQINAPIGNTEATLVGTTFEALGRLMPLPEQSVRPYAFLGAAWRRYDVTGESFTTADAGMNDSTDLLQLPVGAGVEYEKGGFIADARFTFRPSAGGELVLEDKGEYASMHTWGLNAAVGYEF